MVFEDMIKNLINNPEQPYLLPDKVIETQDKNNRDHSYTS